MNTDKIKILVDCYKEYTKHKESWNQFDFTSSYTMKTLYIKLLQVIENICNYYGAPIPSTTITTNPTTDMEKYTSCFWNALLEGTKVDDYSNLLVVIAEAAALIGRVEVRKNDKREAGKPAEE